MKQQDKAKTKLGRRDFLRALGAGAGVAATAAAPLASEANADTENNDEKRKARYKEIRSREDLLPRQPVSELREARRADQENRTPGPPRRASPRPSPVKPRAGSIAAPSCAAPASPPADSPRSARCRSPASARRSRRLDGDRRRHHPQEHLHALLGRLHRHRRSRQRRVGRPGAGLGFADQPRLALRQGRRDARTGARRPPPALSDEARERPMDPHLVGRRDQRDRRQADGDPRQVRRRFGLLARLGQVHQRGLVSQPQARRVLGHQQLRPPGAHLPFHHRRRRRQHLGLRRDDQQLQRHPQRQDHDHHGRQSGRGASGVAAARAGRQGDAAGEHDRHRSAPDAHRGARHRIRAHPLRHRHPGDLGHAVARLQERLGRQAVHRTARLRHGRHPQGSREIHAGRGRAHLRRAGRAARARRQDVRDREAVDPDLVHGRDPAHRRHRQRARVLRRAAGHRQRRQARHRRQHLPRPHQRAGRDRPRPRYRDAAALLRPGRRRVAALVAGLGGRLPVVRRPLRQDHRA